MSPTDHIDREPEGDDIVAAEYVLGVQSGAERAATARRIEGDPAFARLVDAWEVRLAPMAGAYAEAPPPPAAKAAVDRRLFGASASAAPARAGFLQGLAFWRSLAFASLAAFAIVLAVQVFAPDRSGPLDGQLIASLAADDTDVAYVALYDPARGDIALRHMSGDRAVDSDFELWVIEGDAAPVSLGVIPVGANTRLAPPADRMAGFADGAVFAISLEPQGGSPTGQPTGPVVAAGDLRTI